MAASERRACRRHAASCCASASISATSSARASDLYGDGVNIAARLEALAEPGGLCISGKVHDEVRGKVDAIFEDGGERQLKNIATPVRIYRTLAGSTGSPPPASTQPAVRPSIAVLPFANMSGDAEQQYFSDGITEDIITELSRFRQMHVVSRNSSSRFRGTDVDMIRAGRELGVQLPGRRQRAPDGRARAHHRAADRRRDGNHIWAERYDNAQDEIFDVQDRVVRTIVGTTRRAHERSRRRSGPAQAARQPGGLRMCPARRCLAGRNAGNRGRGAAPVREGDRARSRLCPRLRIAFVCPGTGMVPRHERFETASRTRRSTWRGRPSRSTRTMRFANWRSDGRRSIRRAYELAEQHLAKALALNPNQPSVQSDLAAVPHLSRRARESHRRSDGSKAVSTPSSRLPGIGARLAPPISSRVAMTKPLHPCAARRPLSSGQQAWLAASYALGDKPDLANGVRRRSFAPHARFLRGPIPGEGAVLMRPEDRLHLADGLRKAGLPE